MRLTELYITEALERVPAQSAGPGDIVAIAGIEEITIGETLADPDDPRPLEPLRVDEPSLSMTIGINTSPVAGREGSKLTARLVKSRLDQELVGNVSLRVRPTDRPDAWEVHGRGELQLAVLIETMRREGFELTVGKPHVVVKVIDGKRYEPMERVTVDVPEAHVGTITTLLSTRKGELLGIVNHGTGWVRMDWRVPARGLVGVRTEFMTETRGTGVLNHVADGWAPWLGAAADAPGRGHGRGPDRADDGVRAARARGARRAVRRARRRGLRGDDRRRERAPRGDGRQPHEGEEADEHALVDLGGDRAADAADGAVLGAGARVHRARTSASR